MKTKLFMYIMIGVLVAALAAGGIYWYWYNNWRYVPSATDIVRKYEGILNPQRNAGDLAVLNEYLKWEGKTPGQGEPDTRAVWFFFPGSTPAPYNNPTGLRDQLEVKYNGSTELNRNFRNNMTQTVHIANYSSLGWNRFYKHLLKPEIGGVMTRDERERMYELVSRIEGELFRIDELTKRITPLNDGTFNPETLTNHLNIHNQLIQSLTRLTKTNLELSNMALNTFNTAVQRGGHGIRVDSTYALLGTLEADLLLTYTAMLDSYSRLFVEQMRTATFWHLHRAGGSNVFHATHELSGATANPVLVLGEEIRNITTDQFNDLSLAANFGNIRGDYFAMKARVEIFATLIEPFNNAVRIFNFAGLREEVIRNFGPSGYTLNNVRGYLGARALSEEEQRTVRTASVEDQNRYEFVQRVLFDDFEHNMFAPMTAYLARIADLT